MTLIKSLLLGSAAGVVAVSAAQAADLPTRKGPVAAEYVRICSITVAGAPVVGFVLPGSDTCIKFSGYVTAQVEGGNLSNGYFLNNPAQTLSTQRITGTNLRDSFGYTTRFNFTIDAVSNTAYGPLVSHAELQFNHGNGFDNTGNQQFAGSDGGLNRAYVTWAGLTAGKIDSFFSFTGGGLAWANFFSPDRKGFNQPDVLAYTASFGGGFSATISLEDAANGATNNPANSGTLMGYNASAVQGGMRAPDIVGSLDVKQAWGAAHLGAVAHSVRATSLNNNSQLNTWGWALDAGVSFNIPNMAGSTIGLTGAWSRNATWYSGLPDGMWGENGAVNGNGQAMILADAYSNQGPAGTWATPTAWSITGWAQFAVSPQVTLGLEGSYGQVSWSGQNAVSTLYNSKSFIVGGVAHYDPVKNLDFEFELLYQGTQSTQPTGYVAGGAGCGVVGANTCNWQGNASGFAARFEVTRSF
jgi:hypothetical protein